MSSFRLFQKNIHHHSFFVLSWQCRENSITRNNNWCITTKKQNLCRTTLFINSISIIKIQNFEIAYDDNFINETPCNNLLTVSESRPILENPSEYPCDNNITFLINLYYILRYFIYIQIHSMNKINVFRTKRIQF